MITPVLCFLSSMDLSQQELPLTTYFTRGNKDTRSRPLPSRKKKPAEDPHSVARSSKRRKSGAQCSTASPLSSSASQSNSRLTTLQLPTPATSTRKRTHNGRLGLPAKTQLTSNASEEDFAQLESGPNTSKLPQSSKGAILELSRVPFATPLTGRRRTTKSVGAEFTPCFRLSGHGEAGIPTPRTLLQRISDPVDGIDGRSPLAGNCHLPSKPTETSPRSSDSGILLPRVQNLDCPDPFYAYEKDNVSVGQDDALAPPKQYPVQSERLDGQPSNSHAIAMLPIPSSQSQYLLHPDATPKRKRSSRRIEHVISSQTREERELTLSTPHRHTALASLSVGGSPGK